NFEILVVDGLSKDNTVEIARGFRDTRIKVICEEDAGIYDAMNKGIVHSTGQWLHFLGADDQLRLDALETIAEAVKSTQIDVIYGDVWSPRFGGRHDGPFDAQKLFRKNICHQAIFFKKEIFQRTGPF